MNDEHSYTDEQNRILDAIAMAARQKFPMHATFPSEAVLQRALRQFGLDHGFTVRFTGNEIACSRGGRKQKTVATADGSKKRLSSYCGCAFRIRYCTMKGRGDTIKLSKGCHYRHSNGCFPSKEELAQTFVKTRTTSDFSDWLADPRQGKAIRAIADMVLELGSHTRPRWLLPFMKELYPSGIEVTEGLASNLKSRLMAVIADRFESEADGALYNQLFGDDWVCEEKPKSDLLPAVASLLESSGTPVVDFPTNALMEALPKARDYEREAFKALCTDLIQYWNGERGLPIGMSFLDYLPIHLRGPVYQAMYAEFVAQATSQQAAVATVSAGESVEQAVADNAAHAAQPGT